MSTSTTAQRAEETISKLSMFIGEGTLLVRSPGRINLIGEHTDYNEGFVLPAAIDKAAYLAFTPRQDEEIHLYSLDLHDEHHTTLRDFAPTRGASWPNYILGVANQFRQRGLLRHGFDAALTADVPIGAGLSSSAAVENAVALALNKAEGAALDKLTLVKMSQQAEHTYPGLLCGIMDMFASMMGKKDHVIRLDCRSLAYEYEPFAMEGFKIVLLDTQVKHALNDSEYNTRRRQCEQGVALVRERYPLVRSLRDVTAAMLRECVREEDGVIYRRCSYVIEENERLLAACRYLEGGDMAGFGSKMYESHEGLSGKYEVSCPELDFLVGKVRGRSGVLGARMMGGGFGGCTINLVKEEAVEELVADVTAAYHKELGLTLKAYVTQIENGTALL